MAGSAHSQCFHPVLGDDRWKFAMFTAMGKIPKIAVDDEVLFDINPQGIRGGWATWPINFDPTWITCKLPLQ